MPLETATYISQLNSANPAHGDQLSVDDSHMRLVKSTLQATFPNFTAAALNSTQAQLDAAAALPTSGVSVLADAGQRYKTNTGDGFSNPAAGEVDVVCAGASALKVTAATVQPAGSGVLAGPGAMPIGGSIVWWTNTLPTGFGTFAWLNGQAISRTTYAALFALWGTTYGAGDGSTTFNVPDTRSNVLIGSGTMGGAGDPNRITQSGRNTLGSLFGEGTITLSVAQIPTGLTTLNFSDPGHTHSYVQTNNSNATAASGVVANLNLGATTQNTGSSFTGISASITEHGGNGAHDNVPPSVVCNWIVRIL